MSSEPTRKPLGLRALADPGSCPTFWTAHAVSSYSNPRPVVAGALALTAAPGNHKPSKAPPISTD